MGGDWQAWYKEVETIVGTSLDAGINFIDTADVYSEGESERLVGAALKSLERPREQVVIATKVRGRVGPGVNFAVGTSRGHILDGIDQSLKRLGLDHVDLYQIHGFDPATPIEETVRALDAVVQSGKARYVGFSNLPTWLATKAIVLAEAHGLARFQSAQVYYSIAGRDIEREIAPMAQAEGVAILPWSPWPGWTALGQVRPGRQGTPRARAARRSTSRPWTASGCRACSRRCARWPRRTACPSQRVALGWWHLTRPFVTSVIIGCCKTKEQLVDNIAATELKLTADEIKALD